MNHVELAVRGSQRIEVVLKEHFGAIGKGLHELLTSVEMVLPGETVKRARYIASVRNKVVHEAADVDDPKGFSESIEAVLSDLQAIIDRRKAALKARKEAEAREAQERAESMQLRQNTVSVGETTIVTETRMPFSAFLLIIGLTVALAYVYFMQPQRANGGLGLSSNSGSAEFAKLEKTIKTQLHTIETLQSQLAAAQSGSLIKSTDEYLRKAQMKLNEKGFQAGVADGVMGPGTQRALKTFQGKAGLSQTGQLDMVTIAALFSESLSPASAVTAAIVEVKPSVKTESAVVTTAPDNADGQVVNLLSIASQSESDKQAGYAAINEGIGDVLANTSVRIGKVDVNGGDVQVQIGWSIDLSAINKQLKGHLKFDESTRSLEIGTYRQSEYRAYSSELLASLRNKSAYLVLKVGPKTGELKIGGDAHCHVGCRFSSPFGANSFYLDGYKALGGNYPTVVEVKGFTNEQLAAADKVVGWIEWR